MIGSGLYNSCVDYRISVIVIPVIIGKPNIDYSDLTAYLMYRLVPLSLDVMVEYQQGKRVPDDEPPFPTPTPIEPQDYLYKAVCLANALNIRRGPAGHYTIRGHLRSGDEVKVYNVTNGWGAIDKAETEWVYIRYLKKIP